MNILPSALYTAEQTRLLDKTAIETAGIPGFTLMKRAGRAVFSALLNRWPRVASITVLCGGGNNGGDGFVVAALAKQKGLQVQALFVGGQGFAAGLSGEAREAWLWASGEGVHFEPYDAATPLHGEVIVDALLGTGLTGEVREPFAALIERINRMSTPVLSVDIPSGLCSDTGRMLGSAIKADITISFIGLKLGLFSHNAVNHVGEVLFDDLRIPDTVYEQVDVAAFRVTQEDVAECLPPRGRTAHKGDFGHVLVVGGNSGMGGAALMAAEMAVSCGAGKVSLATREEHVVASLIRAPEVMVKGVRSGLEISPLLEQVSVVVIGPGLGRDAWADHMLQVVLQSNKPMVLDADALNLIAEKGLLSRLKSLPSVITPHPGEAARLLGTDTAEIQSARQSSVEQLHRETGAVVLLKGSRTLISDGDSLYVCSAGNPGMASGGMGDVLSGVIGGLLAQKLSLIDAARVGAYAHAHAADLYAEQNGEIGLKATDLIPYVRSVLNGIV